MTVLWSRGRESSSWMNPQGWMSEWPQSGAEGLGDSRRAAGQQSVWESQRNWS